MVRAAPNSKTILIVEDDHDVRDMMAQFLTLSGFETYTAVDRDQATELLDNNPVDVIVLDYMMPGKSAIQFLDQVRRKFPQIKVILVSARSRVEAMARMLGVDTYLPKPLDMQKLLDVLAQ